MAKKGGKKQSAAVRVLQEKLAAERAAQEAAQKAEEERIRRVSSVISTQSLAAVTNDGDEMWPRCRPADGTFSVVRYMVLTRSGS